MKKYLFIPTALLIGTISFGQNVESRLKGLGANPLFFLDSIETTFQEIQTVDPKAISNIDVLLPKTAKKRIGSQAKDGAVFVTTLGFVKHAYTSHFAKKNRKYKRLIVQYKDDSSIAYLINNTFYDNSYSAEIYAAIVSGIRKFKIISKQQYESKYNVLVNQNFVAVIMTKRKKVLSD